MKKIVLLSLILTIGLRINSQQILLTQDIAPSTSFEENRESYPIVNKINGSIAIFQLDDSLFYWKHLDKQYNIIGEYSTVRPEDELEHLLGITFADNKYHFFFSNDSKRDFLVQTIDILNNKSSARYLSIEFMNKKEWYLNSFSYKNRFYILSVKKRSSLLIIYVFEGNELMQKKELDFSDYAFSDTRYSKLFDVVDESISSYTCRPEIQLVDNKFPNTLDITSKRNKIYCNDNMIQMTFDNEINKTIIISIDLNSFESKVKIYKQKEIDYRDLLNLKSNSFIHNNILYQIIASRQEMNFSIYNLISDSLIQEYSVKKDEEIVFKNSDLVQVSGTTYSSQEEEIELDKTKQILRKISKSSIGIAAYQLPHNIDITIGGYEELVRNFTGAIMPTIAVSLIYHFNPTTYGYFSYKNTGSVYFKSLLNPINFAHVSGNIPRNAFDEIKEFSNTIEYKITAETIFKVDDYFVYGYYDKSEKKYYLRKFTDDLGLDQLHYLRPNQR
ncbi:MAG: hypothetical protein K9H64_19060 [Bacteroidales bacterium]|nr:hypothetical protein [Bacteroidales bacterium]MCF8458138.1 hypothetical protein [Bacteroidales bacterium]